MFGIGITEIIVILVVALLVVGPKKLPELAKTLGRTMAEFRKTADDLKESIYQDDSALETDQKRTEVQRDTSTILYPVDPVDDEKPEVLDSLENREEPEIKTSDYGQTKESGS